MLVDLRVQPFPQRLELAGAERRVEISQLRPGRVKQLRGNHVPQAVRGEVPQVPRRPMHILQAAIRVVAGGDSKITLEPFIPGAGQVGRGKFPRHQQLLELKPQHDVQVVRHLIRFHPDETWPHVVDRRVELVERHPLQRLGEHLLRLRKGPLPVGQAAPHQVLPESRLRFVHPQRAGGPQGRSPGSPVQSLLVDSMPRLVQRPKERPGEMVRVVTGCQPAIARANPAAERMGGDIQPPLLKVEPNLRRRLERKRPLGVGGIVAGQDLDRWLPPRLANLANQFHQLAAERGEELRNVGRRHGRLVLVDQGVVRVAFSPGQRLGHLATQGDHAFEIGQKERELPLLAGGDPRLLRERGGLRQLFDQPPRKSGRPPIRPGNLAQVGPFGRGGVGGPTPRGQFAQQFSHHRGSRPFVRQPRQECRLVGPQLRPSGGQAGLLVPPQDGPTRFQQGHLPQVRQQFGIKLFGRASHFRES